MSGLVRSDPAADDQQAAAEARAMVTALAISQHLGTLAAGMRAASAAFPSGPNGWQGPAAQAMSQVLAAEPERFQAVATACAAASTALSGHADRLSSAAWLRRQAGQAPAELAAELHRRAARLADDSARQVAGVLAGLARSAPPRRSTLHRWLHRVQAWRGEVLVGAVESSEQLTDTVAQTAIRLSRPGDPRDLADLEQVGKALIDDVKHPVSTAAALVDASTWRQNPPRAVGHLLPDLMLALASGGTTSAGRTAELLRRSRSAIRTAAIRDSTAREAGRAAARRLREQMIRRALDPDGTLGLDETAGGRAGVGVEPGPEPGPEPWQGPGGTTLTGEQNAGAEVFHALNSAVEPSVTVTLKQISRTAKAELAGLEHRLKELDSFKRKLATDHADTGAPLPALLAKAHDAMRYTVVIDDGSYVQAVPVVTAQLEAHGFHLVRAPKNAWHSGRYRGINTHWQDPVAGATFEVQFHTPASWRITKQTHPLYEDSRLPDTPPERARELRDRIAAAYRAAPAPAGVERLDEGSLLAASTPDVIVPPADYTVYAFAIGGLGAAAASTHPGLP